MPQGHEDIDTSADCIRLHELMNSFNIYSVASYREPSFNKEVIPQNGIYVIFERGEYAHGKNRIVRIGTHTGNNQLRSRIWQHFINENKDRSVFRKNIGRALLNRENDPFLAYWEKDRTTKAGKESTASIDHTKLQEVERRVTKYMQDNFSFAVFEVNKKEDRLRLESRMISTVSLCKEHKASDSWLGKYSPKQKIRESGLWLVNELHKKPLTEAEFDEIGSIIGRMRPSI